MQLQKENGFVYEDIFLPKSGCVRDSVDVSLV